jgi:hypothetical protein
VGQNSRNEHWLGLNVTITIYGDFRRKKLGLFLKNDIFRQNIKKFNRGEKGGKIPGGIPSETAL